jgi:hypothetical protein
MESAQTAGSIAAYPGRRTETGRYFFVGMAVLLLTLNIVGFAPSFFLRARYGKDALPLLTHLHGIVFMSWFVLFLVQSSLVATGRPRLHRRLGAFGAGLAALMVVSGLATLYRGVLEVLEAGGSVVRASQFLWGNLALLLLFVVFVALAIVFRRRRAAHGRLMLLASLSMMPQSLARLGEFEPIRIGPASDVVYALGGLVLLLATVVIYDLWARGRPHPAVLWGAPAIVAAIALAAVIVPATGFGLFIVDLIY